MSLRDVVDEKWRKVRKMGARGLALEAARMAGKPAAHRRGDIERMAETHLGKLGQRLLGIGVGRKHQAAALGANWYESAPYYSTLDSSGPDLGQVMAATGQKAFEMAFILAGGGCTPSWDGTDPVASDTQVGSVINEVRKAVRGIETAEKVITAAHASRNFQEKNLDAEKKRYENGMSTSFQITQIQDQLTQAKQSEVNAVVGYRTALAEYYRSIGKLLPELGVKVVDPKEPIEELVSHSMRLLDTLIVELAARKE